MEQKAVIFDLDGTLIDSLEDLANSVNEVLSKNNYKTHEIDKYKYFIGDGAKVLIQRAVEKEIKEEELEKLHEQFKEVYKNKIDSNTKVYDGIYELLEKLENISYKKSILSNKPDIFTQQCVQKFFEKYNFVNISGQKKHIPKKPDAKAALQIAQEMNKNPNEVYFVGDTKVDMQTAKNAGMVAIGVLWGFRSEAELRENGADFIVQNTQELFDILSNDTYIPIACHFYDELESAAVKRIKSKIAYKQNDEIVQIEDYLVDFKIRHKQEFAVLKNGLEIRLDKIVEFNGLNPLDYGCGV